MNPKVGKVASLKTHLESDSNFDEFLLRFDKKRRDSHDSEAGNTRNMDRQVRSGLPKTIREQQRDRNINEDSDILRFSTD